MAKWVNVDHGEVFISFVRALDNAAPRLDSARLLLALAGISLLIVFFLLLPTWGTHPAVVTEGVHGK